MTQSTADNPLLIGEGLPPFDRLQADQVVPAMTQLLQELDQQLTDLETQGQPTWAGLMEPLTALEE
ncbi:MAG: hypothetical protein ACKOX2_10625, partial [Microcystaceae cyanobacterium]